VPGALPAVVQAIYQLSKFANSVSSETYSGRFGVILNQTNFYAEQGGQQFDVGNLVVDGSSDFEVEDVQIFGGYILHIGYLKYGEISIGSEVVASYDAVCFGLPIL
jgi:alanyl-tRNA synthetase